MPHFSRVHKILVWRVGLGDPLFVAISLRAAGLLEPLGPQQLPFFRRALMLWIFLDGEQKMDENQYENRWNDIFDTPVM